MALTETEQYTFQIWIGNMLRLLKDGDHKQLQVELESAIGVIEEDIPPLPQEDVEALFRAKR